MNVLSLFDGISCGQIALERVGIKVNNYYSSEIDNNAIKITQNNYPNTIQIGDVTKIKYRNNTLVTEKGIYKDKIDLLIGGSPCQGFSSAGKMLNFKDERSMLFFEYVRLLKEVKPKYFLLENVKMKKQWQDIITRYLGVQPIEINSSLVSAQNRVRLYWTNIPNIKQPNDQNILIKDILDDILIENKIQNFKESVRKNVVNEYENILNTNKKIYQLKCKSGWQDNKIGIKKTPTLRANNSFCLIKTPNNVIRRITINEAEKLQNIPVDYTKGISENQRFKCIGNAWTVDVIAHIFNELLKKEGE